MLLKNEDWLKPGILAYLGNKNKKDLEISVAFAYPIGALNRKKKDPEFYIEYYPFNTPIMIIEFHTNKENPKRVNILVDGKIGWVWSSELSKDPIAK